MSCAINKYSAAGNSVLAAVPARPPGIGRRYSSRERIQAQVQSSLLAKGENAKPASPDGEIGGGRREAHARCEPSVPLMKIVCVAMKVSSISINCRQWRVSRRRLARASGGAARRKLPQSSPAPISISLADRRRKERRRSGGADKIAPLRRARNLPARRPRFATIAHPKMASAYRQRQILMRFGRRAAPLRRLLFALACGIKNTAATNRNACCVWAAI